MTVLEKLQYLLDRGKITLEQIAPEYREQLEVQTMKILDVSYSQPSEDYPQGWKKYEPEEV